MIILILDDHPLILETIKKEVKSLLPNCEIHSFVAINEAVSFIQHNKVNFAICDIQIIQGKNIELPRICQLLKIPYMVYSSHVTYGLCNTLFELGVSVYVSKLSNMTEFQKGLSNLFLLQKFHCSIVKSSLENNIQQKDTLPLTFSKVQHQILILLNSGMTQTEVASYLSIANRTVINHLALLRINNNCNTTAELIRRFQFWES